MKELPQLMVDLPVLYRAYLSATARYGTPGYSSPLTTRAFLEWPIRLLAVILGRLRGIRFPKRAIGGWWWIWRYRFEMLVGWYEYPTSLWMHRLVRPGMIVADVGAHIGYFSRLLSRLVGPTGKVLAFEPSPENYPLLIHNLSRAGARNVLPIQAAVADKPGRPLLYVSPGHSNHSLFSGYTENEAAVAVDAVTVDDFCRNHSIGRLDLVKIDAEGAEPQVLAGMRSMLSANPQLAMIVEVNPIALRAAGSSPEQLLGLLRQYGFLPQLIEPNGRLALPADQDFSGGPNLLCLRGDSWDALCQ